MELFENGRNGGIDCITIDWYICRWVLFLGKFKILSSYSIRVEEIVGIISKAIDVIN